MSQLLNTLYSEGYFSSGLLFGVKIVLVQSDISNHSKESKLCMLVQLAHQLGSGLCLLCKLKQNLGLAQC